MSLKRCKKLLQSKRIQYDFVTKFNALCNDLDNRYDINHGGCCFVAGCIARILEEANIEFSLVVFDNCTNLKKYVDIDDLPNSMNHYAIVIDDKNDIIGDGINCDEDDFDDYYQTFKVTSKKIFKHYYEHRWNNVYNCFYNFRIRIAFRLFYHEYSKSLLKKYSRS